MHSPSHLFFCSISWSFSLPQERASLLHPLHCWTMFFHSHASPPDTSVPRAYGGLCKSCEYSLLLLSSGRYRHRCRKSWGREHVDPIKGTWAINSQFLCANTNHTVQKLEKILLHICSNQMVLFRRCSQQPAFCQVWNLWNSQVEGFLLKYRIVIANFLQVSHHQFCHSEFLLYCWCCFFQFRVEKSSQCQNERQKN